MRHHQRPRPTLAARIVPAYDSRILVQFPRFVSSGMCAAGADFTTYTVLAKVVGIHPLVANLISRPLGGVLSFLLNKYWTFGNAGASRTRVQFLRFWIVWCLSFGISESLIGVFHVLLGLGPIPTKVLAEGCAAVFTFLCHRFWTFR